VAAAQHTAAAVRCGCKQYPTQGKLLQSSSKKRIWRNLFHFPGCICACIVLAWEDGLDHTMLTLRQGACDVGRHAGKEQDSIEKG
jgi:hypothetical protein